VVGELIGSYRILSQLGAGAMGQVFLAEHRHLKRKAALKLLAPELVGRPDLLERFFLEARATSAIAHPGIVQIFDCEIDATGRPYIVMEYLTGETLAALLARRGPLAPASAARMARTMAEALSAAHAQGIVHRDLKPENVFVQAQPADSVKLLDFGIAKLAGEFQAGQIHKTHSGALMGTPLYMSPEQCRDSARIDYRTDLYSLGCVLHETLVGRPPFTYEALGDLMIAHMTEQPKDLRAVNPAVPPALAQLVSELLRKDPAQRPASMQDVAARLATYIGGVTTVPNPATAPTAAAIDPTLAAFAPGGSQAAPPPALPAHVATSPPANKTTFGDSASEVVAAPEEQPPIPRRRAPIVVVAVLAVAGIAAAAVVVRSKGRSGRERAPAAAPGVSAATAPPTPPPVAPAPTPAPAAPAPTPVAAAQPTPAAPIEPAPSAPAVPERHSSPAAAPAHGKHAHRTVAEASPEAASAPTATPAAAAVPTSPPPADAPRGPELTGAWEGPWNDPGKQQSGRLFLQLAPTGAASGWMFNRSANMSFRLVGRVTPAGDLSLICQCPPQQGFAARGSVHLAGGSELSGQLALSARGAVFGESHFVLKRGGAPARAP
jgi:serine/threonine-protein kinase